MKLTTFLTLVGLGAALAAEVPMVPPAKVIVLPPTKNVALAWDAPTNGAGLTYRVYWGPTTGTYTNHIASGTKLTGTVSNLAKGRAYYFAATALNAQGESDFSNEVIQKPGVRLTNVVVAVTGTNLSWSTNAHKGPWALLATNVTILSMTNPIGRRFWRGKGAREVHRWQ